MFGCEADEEFIERLKVAKQRSTWAFEMLKQTSIEASHNLKRQLFKYWAKEASFMRQYNEDSMNLLLPGFAPLP